MDDRTWSVDGNVLTLAVSTARYPLPETLRLTVEHLDKRRLVLGGTGYLAGTYRRDDKAAGKVQGNLILSTVDSLPADAVVQVRMDAVSLSDSATSLIASDTFFADGLQSPLPYFLVYDNADIDIHRPHRLSALILLEGTLCFKSTGDLYIHDWLQPVHMDIKLSSPDRPAAGRGYQMRGMFLYLADAALFTDCVSGETLPVAMEGGHVELERAYSTLNAAGKPVYAEFMGRIAQRPKMEGRGSRKAVLVSRFITLQSEDSCRAADGNAGLTGTWWHLLALVDMPVFPAQGEEMIYLMFHDDGRLNGSDGCNRLMGNTV